MAAKLSSTENRPKNDNQASVVILDSDEEEEQTTKELFEGFIKAVQSFLERKEVLLLRVKYAEIRPGYASCPAFREMLRRKTSQVRNTDVYIHFNDVLKDLIGNAALYGRNATKQSEDREVKTSGEVTSDGNTESNEGDRRTTVAGKLKTDQQGAYQITSKPGTSSESPQSSQETIQSIEIERQYSSSQEFETKKSIKNTSVNDQLKEVRKKKRKKQILKLEKRLKYVSDEIKRLTESELSLAEMELGDSNYIKESRLKEQFNKIWEKICFLKRRPPNTGRVHERQVKVKGTNFPAIDKAMKKFLNKKKGFPNIFDVRNVVIKVNKKHGLGLTQSVIQEIAADVFTDIGNKKQKKRKMDFEYNFGCHLTDNCLSSLDPALNDDRLRRKLDENKRISKTALDNVFDKYVHLGRIKGQDKNESSSNYSGSSSDSDEQHVRKKTRRKKRESPYDSDKDKRTSKRIKLTDKENDINTSTSSPKVDVSKSCEQLSSISDNSGSSDACTSKSKENGVKYDSIEIIDDDDDDDRIIVNHNHQPISEKSESISGSENPTAKLNDETTTPNGFGEFNHVKDSPSHQSVNSVNLTINNGPLNDSDVPNAIEIVNVAQVSNNSESHYNVNSKQPKTHNDHSNAQNLDKQHHNYVHNSSLDSSCPVSTSKEDMIFSKLHLKIQQLRDKKLTGLISKGNASVCSTSEDKHDTKSGVFNAKHQKRKSKLPHQIQEHANASGSTSANEASEICVINNSYCKNGNDSEIMSNVSSDVQPNPISCSAIMSNNDNVDKKKTRFAELVTTHYSNHENRCGKSTTSNVHVNKVSVQETSLDGLFIKNTAITKPSCKYTSSSSSKLSSSICSSMEKPETFEADGMVITNSPLSRRYQEVSPIVNGNVNGHSYMNPNNGLVTAKASKEPSNNNKSSPSRNVNTIIILSDDED